MGVTWNDDRDTVAAAAAEVDDIDAQFAALQAMLDERMRRADAARFCCRKPIPCRGCPRLWADVQDLEAEPTA